MSLGPLTMARPQRAPEHRLLLSYTYSEVLAGRHPLDTSTLCVPSSTNLHRSSDYATQINSRRKHRSHDVSTGADRAAARAMLRAVGLKDEDMDKPFIGVANLASDVTPCNVHLNRLAKKTKEGVWNAGCVPFLLERLPSAMGSPWARRV